LRQQAIFEANCRDLQGASGLAQLALAISPKRGYSLRDASRRGAARGADMRRHRFVSFFHPRLSPRPKRMTVLSQNFNNATVQITVANLGSDPSVPATMTINVHPTQAFSYSAGAGTDCTASGTGFDSQFTCPVPVIPGARTYTRTLTINNLSNQAPHFIQTDATTIMPGDTNPNNNTGFANVTLR
jgi:hypothetical protein